MKLGQHFLTDSSIAEKMVDYANVSNKDTVLEIGPGEGIITKILSERAKNVVAIEMDKKLAEEPLLLLMAVLRERFGDTQDENLKTVRELLYDTLPEDCRPKSA